MEILQPYNNDTLQLISDNTDYIFTESDLQNGKIKISVFSDVNTFLQSEDLQENIDFYVKNDELFLKPNEFLDRNGFSENNYNLQFDFLKRFSSNFNIAQISPTRQEIRLSAPTVSIDSTLREIISNFMNEDASGEVKDTYQFNSYFEISEARLIPINSYAFDFVTNNKTTLVLKLNEPLPSDIPVLSTDFNISNKFLSSQTETIFFIDREGLAVSGLGLDVDASFVTLQSQTLNSYDNYNQITSSVGENIVEKVNRLQKDINLNIDYEKFDGHVFFGSAKSKLENFKNKVVSLDTLYAEISSSLKFTDTDNIVEKRKDLFKQIRDIERDFTHYEHFMYNDGQSYSTSSAPGVGGNLAGTNYTNNVDNSFTSIQGQSGFDRVYKKEEDGFIHVFTDVYNVEQPPFYNSSDFFYLSFLAKGDTNHINNKYSLVISGGLANEKYNTVGTSLVGNYPYYNDRQVPFNAFSGSAMFNPQVTGSNYQRYVFRAQQNFFRPSDRIIDGVSETFEENSTHWIIISGSNQLSDSLTQGQAIIDISGVYVPHMFPSQVQQDGTINLINFVTASILPQGDLFPVFSEQTGSKDILFTDVVLTKNDPTNVLPFSKTYRPPNGTYGGSSEWNSWYNTMETIAEEYDDRNIHSLVNNLPEILQIGPEHKVLRDFVNMLGEQFDLLRSYIDNYHNIYKLGYKNPNAMPDNLLPIIGDSLGFDLKNPMSGSLEDYLEGTRGDEISDKKAIASLWTKILNNLIYIYKTKGTQESINTLLNLYGYDTESFKLTEYGGSTDEHNPSVVTNDAKNDLGNGLRNKKGNVSFRKKKERIRSLNLSKKEDKLALDWYSNDAKPNGVEFIFKTTKTNNVQKLLRASGSEDNWDLRIIPSGSSTTKGKIEFRLNNSVNGSGAIASNAISMSTDFIDNVNDNKYFNILLQKNIPTSSAELTQSYSLMVARKDDDKIKDVQHISMSSFDVNANKAFITASGQTSNNFLIGEEMTGSIAEVRAWDTPISMSKVKQHTLNYKSTVAGTPTSTRDNLVYHFPLDDAPGATTIKDISSPNKIKNYDKSVSSQPSLSTIKSSISTVNNYSFQVRGTDVVKSDKQYKIGSDLNPNGGLSDKTTTLTQPVKAGTNEPKVKVIPKIGKTFSYVDAIDSIVINSMADFEIDDYLDDYDNNGIYDDLLTLRKQLIEERLIQVDIVDNLTTVENHTDDPVFIENIEKVLPAKTKLEFSYEVKNDTLFRSKIKKANLQTELNPNNVIGSTNLSEPNLSVNFNENKHEASVNVPSDEFTVSSLVNENLKEKNINVLIDEVNVSGNANDKVHSNSAIELNITDLSDSSNQTVFNVEPDNFTNLLLGSKNEFYKNAGKSENQTFFKSGNPGSDGNYNTYRYEDRFFFRTIGDIEEFFPTSGTLEDRTGNNAKQPFNHHTNFRHFGNRYYVDSGSGYTYTSFFGSKGATVNGRMVGRTLFFSASNGEIFYPINHYFKVGTSKDGLTNLIYKGTQNDGSNPPQFDPELDVFPSISAYKIDVGGSDTTRKLKVIR